MHYGKTSGCVYNLEPWIYLGDLHVTPPHERTEGGAPEIPEDEVTAVDWVRPITPAEFGSHLFSENRAQSAATWLTAESTSTFTLSLHASPRQRYS